MTSEQHFERLVSEALDELPGWVLERMDNVDVTVEDDPPHGQPNLLGLYHGIPLTKRGAGYTSVMPDRITLYHRPIEARARTDAELKRMVAHTVAHEVAHHFGISDDRLREIGRY